MTRPWLDGWFGPPVGTIIEKPHTPRTKPMTTELVSEGVALVVVAVFVFGTMVHAIADRHILIIALCGFVFVALWNWDKSIERRRNEPMKEERF